MHLLLERKMFNSSSEMRKKEKGWVSAAAAARILSDVIFASKRIN